MFKYTAIMIEPREHKAMHFVLNNFLTNLSDDWEIRVLVGDDNINYVTNIVKQLCDSDRLKVINIGIKNLSQSDYSKLLVTKSFYDNIHTEMFLIFQTDSMIFPQYKEYIYNYMDYDYVGAPWTNGDVGNGGLSLRRKSRMLEIIDRGAPLLYNEDGYFAWSYPINKPSFELAKLFSIETVFSENSFGIHNAWKYLSQEQIEFLKNKYEGLNDLIELNSSFN
jgi:hypothetical protein